MGSPLQVRYTKSGGGGGAIRFRFITKRGGGGGGGGAIRFRSITKSGGGERCKLQKLRKPGPAPHKRTLTLLGGGGGGGVRPNPPLATGLEGCTC